MYSRMTFDLPFRGLRCLAMSDPALHTNESRYAIDFLLPLGTEVLAAAPGAVEEVKLDSRVGGAERAMADDKWLNYVVLRHADSEYSIYGHLGCDSRAMSVGRCVARGEPIGVTGVSGLMTVPHLHFHVYTLNRSGEPVAMRPRLRAPIVIHRPRRSSELEQYVASVRSRRT